MKKLFLFLLTCLLINTISQAKENTKVTNSLRNKYAMAQYHADCGGWYLLRFAENGQTYYGMSDNAGNVIASYADEYELHNGYIRMHLIDLDKKQKHDEWLKQKYQYDKEYQKYAKIRDEYQSRLSAYNQQVASAKSYANEIYQQRRQEAYQRGANAETKRIQAQAGNNVGAQLGALLGTAITGGASIKAAGNREADKVQKQPIVRQVLQDRGLTNPPDQPYNPEPYCPREPDSGYAWQTFDLMQPCPYSYVEYAAIQERGKFADVKKDGKYGLVDYQMNEIIPCTNAKSVKVGTVCQHLLICVNDQYGLLSASGKMILPLAYQQIKEFNENCIWAQKDGKWGIYNSLGTTLTQPVYSEYQRFNNNLLAKVNDKWQYIRDNGQTIISGNFDKIELKNDYLYCQQAGLWGIYTKDATPVLPLQYEEIKYLSSQFYCKRNGKWGTFTSEGQPLLPIEFDNIEQRDGYMFCTKDKKIGIFQIQDAKQLYDCQFQAAEIESAIGKTFLHAKMDGHWGLLDFATGEQILPYAFVKVEITSMNGTNYLRTIRYGKDLRDLLGLYGMAGQLLVPCEYDAIELKQHPVLGSIFETHKNGKVNIYDATYGLRLLPDKEYTGWTCIDSLLYVKNGNKSGLASVALGEIIECRYDKIQHLKNNNCFLVETDGKQTLVTFDGKELFAPIPYSITIRHDYLLIEDQSFRMGAADYTGNIIVPVKEKKSANVAKKVEKYQKKHVLPSDNIETINRVFAEYNEKKEQEQQNRSSFEFFAKSYVERVINDWQKKGEFEKTENWQKRVNTDTRTQKIYDLTQEAERLYVAQEKKNIHLNLTLGDYDSDNEVYMLTEPRFGKLLVQVPIEQARTFRDNWNNASFSPKYFIDNGEMAISQMEIDMPNNIKYQYSNELALNYEVADIKYHFDPINIFSGIKMGQGYLQSVEIISPLHIVEYASVLALYNNDFREFEMPERDITFPYALFRIELEGDAKAVKSAKEMLMLNLGQMFKVARTVTSYSNKILYLVPTGVKNVEIECGDGCTSQLLFSGRPRTNAVYDATIRVK